MGHSFYVKAGSSPVVSKIVQEVEGGMNLPLEVEEEEFPLDEEVPWPETPGHFFVRNKSTRGVAVYNQGGEFEFRLNVLSSPEDWEAAIRLACVIAKAAGVKVEPEDGDPTDPDYDLLAENYLGTALNDRYWFEYNTVRSILEREESEGTLTMPSVKRNVVLGPRTYRQIEEEARACDDWREPGQKGEKKLHPLLRTLFKWMSRVNFLTGYEEWFEANTMSITSKETGEGFTLQVWGPGVDYVFSGPDRLALVSPEGGMPMIPYSALAKITPEDCITWLDEQTAAVDHVPDDRWMSFLELCQPFRIDE